MTVYVTADWSRVVPEGSPEAAFGVQPKDLRRLGLEPDPSVEQAEPEVLTTANTAEPEPSSKQDGPPEDKAAPKPEDKAARRPSRKET